jgi:sugar (pentulose or hexulose) kinase
MTPRRAVVLGVDIGTTNTKVVVADGETGRQLALSRQPTAWTQHSNGQVDTSPASIVAGVRAAVDAAVGRAEESSGGPVQIIGIGIAGIAESGVLLDRGGAPITPVIAWFDPRGAAELRSLDTDFQAAFPARTGLPLGPHSSFAKLLWWRGQGLALSPEHRWLNLPEYVAYELTGQLVTEPSLASRTGLLDQATGVAWPAALELLGAAEGLLPPQLVAGRSAGVVRAAGALRGAVVTVAGHDHSVAAIGVGAVGADQLFNSAGTADVLLRSVPRILTDADREQLVAGGIETGRHVLAGRSALIGSVRAGLVLRRVLALLGRAEPAQRAELDQRWRPDAEVGALQVRGARGDDDSVTIVTADGATPDRIWAAALRHIGTEMAALLAIVNKVVDEHAAAIAAGGWTRLRSVRAIKASVIPRLTFSGLEEPGATGAALFAAWAAIGDPGLRSANPPGPAGSTRPANPADPADLPAGSASPPHPPGPAGFIDVPGFAEFAAARRSAQPPARPRSAGDPAARSVSTEERST